MQERTEATSLQIVTDLGPPAGRIRSRRGGNDPLSRQGNGSTYNLEAGVGSVDHSPFLSGTSKSSPACPHTWAQKVLASLFVVK